MKLVKLLFIIVLLYTLGCDKKEAAELINKPSVYDEFFESGEVPNEEFAPKAEIIFVVDNSKSMEKHIDNVSLSIDRFVDAFSRNNILEYNLAVVSVYDQRRFTSAKFLTEFANSSNVYDKGEFRQVKSANNTYIKDKFFISSKDSNLKELLRHTLKVPVLDLDNGGPEVEELFSPLAAIYSIDNEKPSAIVSQLTAPFFMGSNSFKIVFFITDAPDASIISAGDLYKGLVQRSGGDENKVLGFGAIIPIADSSCPRDPGGKTSHLEDFLSKANAGGKIKNNIVSLCSIFGDKFAEFGDALRQQTLSQKIKLRTTPNYKTIKVTFGEQNIPLELNDADVGFRYDPATNSVHIHPNFEFDIEGQPGAKIDVNYDAIDPRK